MSFETDMIWWIVATLAAFFVKGVCGFANTLVFTTILSFSNNNINITPVDLVIGYPANAFMAYKERKSIRLRVVLPLAAVVITATIPGMLFLKNVDASLLKKIFGVIVVFLGLEMFQREFSKKQWKERKAVLVIIGILAGIMCGIYGIGALMSAYISRVTKDSHGFKGNMSLVLFLENSARLVFYIGMGIFTTQSLWMALCLLPFVGIGLAAGMLCSRHLNEKTVRRCVFGMLVISGLALILR